MHTNVEVSTKFHTTQNAHQVGLLVTIGADAPVNRPPINVALVLDRSGTRDQAVQAADQGQFEAAASLMHRAAASLASACPDATEEIADLQAQAERLAKRRYEREDRKYNIAMKDAMFMSRTSYADKIRRPR